MSERILKINGQKMDIDELTAIGISFQAYDFKEPGKSRVNISNSFTIPYTIDNANRLGQPYDPQSTDLTIYNELNCEYFIDNEVYIQNALARVEGVDGDRISLFVYEKNSFIDEMKRTDLADFIKDFITGPYRAATPTDVSTPAILSRLCTVQTEIVRLFVNTDFSLNFDPTATTIPDNPGGNSLTFVGQNDFRASTTDQAGLASTGSLFIKVRDLFDYIEDVFGVDFNLSVADTLGTDALFNAVYMHAPSLFIGSNTSTYNTGSFQGVPIDRFAVMAANDSEMNFRGIKDGFNKNSYGGKTVYDFFNTVLQQFGSYLSRFGLDGDYILTKLDLIFDLKDSQGLTFEQTKLPGLPDQADRYIIEPKVGEFSQRSLIKVANPQDGVSPLEGGAEILGFNRNLDGESDLFETDIYQAPLITVGGVRTDYLGFDDEKSLESLCFVLPETQTINITWSVFYYRFGGVDIAPATAVNTNVISQFALGGEYELFRRIAAYPQTIKEKRWVTPEEMRGFRTYTPYHDGRLGGWFFCNLVSNFNPAKSKEGANFELIRIRSNEVSVNESLTTWNYINSGGSNAVYQGLVFADSGSPAAYRKITDGSGQFLRLFVVFNTPDEREIFMQANTTYTITDPGGAQTVFEFAGENSESTQYISFELIRSTVEPRAAQLTLLVNDPTWPANTAQFSMNYLDRLTNENIFTDLIQTINIDSV